MQKLFRILLAIASTTLIWTVALWSAGLGARYIPPLDRTVTMLLKHSGLQLTTPAPPSAQTSPVASKPYGDDVSPLLPRLLFATVGRPLTIYFDNLLLLKDPDKVRIEIDAGQLNGTSLRRSWTVTPQAADVGTHKLTVRIRNWAGEIVAEAGSSVEVVATPTLKSNRNVLLVGDSITHQSIYPNTLFARLVGLIPNLHFVGTHHPKATLPIYRDALEGVSHEGYGGWSWGLFASHHLPGQEKFYKLTSSPFVFADGEKPKLDVGRYLRERAKVDRLDAAVFLLGLNETFSASPDDPASIDQAITTAIANADQLIKAFRLAAPNAALLVALPPPFTRSEATFRFKYAAIKPEFGDAWRHRRIQHAVARRLMEHFEKAQMDKVFIVPSHLGLDVIDGYWLDDAGHPNEIGGGQLAESILPALYIALSGR